MDFFTSLLSLPLAGPARADRSPQDVVAELDRSWQAIQNTLITPDERQLLRGIGATDVPKRLSRMVDELVLESGRSEGEDETPPALDWFLTQDVLATLVQLCEPDRPAGIKAEVLKAVSNLCVTMESRFLVQAPVHKPLVRLLQMCTGDEAAEGQRVLGAASSAAVVQPAEYEEHVVDLMCILCSKIKASPSLLLIFFLDKAWARNPQRSAHARTPSDATEQLSDRAASPALSVSTITSSRATSSKPEFECLLFTFLLRWVHREGRTGDLARAGILFLLDVAMGSSSSSDPSSAADVSIALAEFILDGDLAEVLAAGLGAVYSVLPPHLAVLPPESDDATAGATSAMRIGATPAELDGLETCTSPVFQAQLSVFLSVLEFTAEIVRRGFTSASRLGIAIAEGVIAAVRNTFLGSVLYPSILECSDNDGSAVAVLSYLEIMLATLGEGPLTELLLSYLVAEEDPVSEKKGASRATKHSRRKSTALVLLQNEQRKARGGDETAYFSSSLRFTLKDLILTNVASSNQSSAVAALKLLSTLLSRHHRLVGPELLCLIPDPAATAFPFLPPSLPVLPPRPATPDSDTFVYPEEDEPAPAPQVEPTTPAAHVRPMSTTVRELGLYLSLIGSIDTSPNREILSTGFERYLEDAMAAIEAHPDFFLSDDDRQSNASSNHRLDPSDRLLGLLLSSLRSFFSNSPEHNIALSGVFAGIAQNPCRSLEGWLVFGNGAASTSASGLLARERETSAADGDDDGDDRSVDDDYATLANVDAPSSQRLPSLDRFEDAATPVVFATLKELVNQLETYRQQVEAYDNLLRERRRGLLFRENLNDALAALGSLASSDDDRSFLVAQFESDVASSSSPDRKPLPATPLSHRTAPPPPPVNTPATPTPVSHVKAKTRGLASFFTPRKKRESAAPETPVARAGPTTPFADHYRETEAISVRPVVVPPPSAGPWSPAPKRRCGGRDLFWSVVEEREEENAEDVGGDATEAPLPPLPLPEVSLSQLLDNVVVLEETIKELVAIVQARRALGVDLVGFV